MYARAVLSSHQLARSGELSGALWTGGRGWPNHL